MEAVKEADFLPHSVAILVVVAVSMVIVVVVVAGAVGDSVCLAVAVVLMGVLALPWVPALSVATLQVAVFL
jgi:hypothetical protein